MAILLKTAGQLAATETIKKLLKQRECWLILISLIKLMLTIKKKLIHFVAALCLRQQYFILRSTVALQQILEDPCCQDYGQRIVAGTISPTRRELWCRFKVHQELRKWKTGNGNRSRNRRSPCKMENNSAVGGLQNGGRKRKRWRRRYWRKDKQDLVDQVGCRAR